MNSFRPPLASLFGAIIVVVSGCGTAAAQGIDCSKARAPLDRAICGSTALLDQDRAMASAFASALARAPDDAATLRATQIQWLRDRNTACGKEASQPAMQACLGRAYAARLGVLEASASSTPPANTASAANAPAPVGNPQPAAAAAAAPIRQVAESTPEILASPAPPAITIPPAEATLDRTRVPAAELIETLLHVTHPGRFAIVAKSPTGTALQLVDMLTGPSDTVGQAGQTDGRLDVLLDAGTYKMRAFGAPQVTGEVDLSVTAFSDAAAAAGAPVRGRFNSELSDFQQRRFWLTVPPGDPLRLEAAGRSLADLRLWWNGADLVALTPVVRTIEPTPGHPITDIVLQGTVPPGSYELVAYGGRAQTWADGSAAQPFHLRNGASDALAAGWIAGRIGPFGNETYRVGPAAGGFRLDLPQPAPTELTVVAGSERLRTSIARNQRVPTAWIAMPPVNDAPRLLELRGTEGQPFQLRVLSGAVTRGFARPGTYWMSADGLGYGGDEVPMTYVFTQRPGYGAGELLASVAPRVGPGVATREKFNLRGPVAIAFEVTAPGPVMVRTEGMAVQASVAAIGATIQSRADGASPTVWDLAAGFYVLGLTPVRNAVGIVDVTLGPPGVSPAAPADPQVSDPALPLGVRSVAFGDHLELAADPGSGERRVGLLLRPVPVDLASGALAVTMAPGASLSVPVRLPADGALIATEVGSGPVAAAFDAVAGPTAGRIGTARVAAVDRARTLMLAWKPPIIPPQPIATPPPASPLQALAAGTAQFLDLAKDEQRAFALSVPTGGSTASRRSVGCGRWAP